MPNYVHVLPLLVLAVASLPASAQERSRPLVSLGAQAVGLVTHASPAFDGRAFTEGYLTQPAIMAHAALLGGRLGLRATVDFEGVTLRRGELTPGSYGEGYVDRRHPHTYTHEVIAVASTDATGRRPFAASLAAGKGFAPFGTDDPMMRPFVKFPANHHLAQILERVVAIGALRAGPLALEGGAFNGDEPTRPGAPPTWSRFADSWAGRVTLAPRGGRFAGVELQGSHAQVESPEFTAGSGFDQRKWSASARLERGSRGAGGHRYALVEWARTDDLVNGRRAFTFTSLLGEGALSWRGAEVALRLERTVRPEEERLADPFRAVRPHTDASILGRTRWTIATAHAALGSVRARALRAAPFVEVTRSHAAEVTRPSAFEPAAFFGSAAQWGVSAGVRFELGVTHRRMGRYGIAESPDPRGDHGHGAPETRRARDDTHPHSPGSR